VDSTSNSTKGTWRFNRWLFESLFMFLPWTFVLLFVLLAVVSVLVPWPWVPIVYLGAIVVFFAVLVTASLRRPSDSP